MNAMNHYQKERESGFSIIELAIILTIFSFFVVNILVTEDTSKQYLKYDSTHKKLEVIQSALSKYVNKFGHYPCPADGGLIISDPNIGVAADSTTSALDISLGRPGCNRNNASVKFYATVADPAIAANNADIPRSYTDVIVGAVPVRDLELPLDYFVDSFGNRIMYAVREELTSTATFGMATNGTDTDPASSPWGTGVQRSLEVVNETAVPIDNNAAYVLMSYGQNGYGAYPFEQGLNYDMSSGGGPIITRLYPPDMTVAGAGSFSAGEQDNHHLTCEVNPAATPTCDAQTLNASNTFDDIFFIPNQPEISSTTSQIIRYDDIVVYGTQESHNVTGNTSDLDTQKSYPMIEYYAGDTSLNPQMSITPDGVLGLSLWLDAQDCKTIFQATPLANNVCIGITVNTTITEWMEKVSIFNNYYRDALTATSTVLGNKAISAGTNRPVYVPADSTGADPNTINGFPTILFDGVNDYMQIDGPFSAAGPTEDVSLRPGTGAGTDTDTSLTVFIVAKKRDNLSVNDKSMPTFFARTNLFNRDVTVAATASDGYTIVGLRNNNTTGNLDWFDGGAIAELIDEVGFGVNDFYNFSVGPGITSRVKIANISHTPPNAGNSINDLPMILVAKFDDSLPTNNVQIFNGCSGGTVATASSISHTAESLNGNAAVSIGRSSILTPTGSLWTGALSGAIGEVLMYERALPAHEIAKLTNYLGDKWGITTNCTVSVPDVDALCTAPSVQVGFAAAGPGNCCSGYHDGTNCCMVAYQDHYEKCNSKADCCNNASCSAFGFCYDSSVNNPPN